MKHQTSAFVFRQKRSRTSALTRLVPYPGARVVADPWLLAFLGTGQKMFSKYDRQDAYPTGART